MEKKNGDEKSVQQSWLPEKFAIKDKIINLKDNFDNWTYGWKVVTVGKTRATEEEMQANRDAWKTQRNASDI